VINIFENEKKIMRNIKLEKTNMERGKFLEPFFTNEDLKIKFNSLFAKHNIPQNVVGKILEALWEEIKLIFNSRNEKISFSQKEKDSLKRHLLGIKKILTQDMVSKKTVGEYLQLFKPVKTLGNNNDTWLDTIDKMIFHLKDKDIKTDTKAKVLQIDDFVTIIGVKLEDFDPKLKPSTYYDEANNMLNLGGEILFLITNFYDKRITKRTIKSALKDYTKKAELIRQIASKK